MKHGMVDVGMLCSQSRFGINTEKGEVSTYKSHIVHFIHVFALTM